MMSCRHVINVLKGVEYAILPNRWGVWGLGSALYHCSGESHEQDLPLKWYKEAFPKIERLTRKLQNVDMIDRVLVNVLDDSIILDDRAKEKMNTLKSLVRVFVGCPLVQRRLREKMEEFYAGRNRGSIIPFSKTGEREGMVVSSLTQVSKFLNISAQQKKVVRVTISPQVTQHRIWAGSLEEILNGLKFELNCLSNGNLGNGNEMVQQIICSCLKCLADPGLSWDQGFSSWMKLAPAKGGVSPSSKWEDVHEMFDDLILSLGSNKDLFYHIEKLQVMKEGLYQVKDVLIDRSIGYKEVRYQEGLIQKKLSKTLGHPSRCLFTLVLYYLYGHVRDLELDMRGGIHSSDGGKNIRVYMGKILTSDEEKVVQNGVKQLDRALGLFKFIWETAGMKESLVLEGHLWSVGARDRTINYRGNVFFVHGICLD